MKARLKAQGEASEKGDAGGDRGDDIPATKRRRLALIFGESDSSEAAAGGETKPPEVIVAVRKGNIVGTAFHPELTSDCRWHQYFVKIVEEAIRTQTGGDKRNPEEAPVAPGLEIPAADANPAA